MAYPNCPVMLLPRRSVVVELATAGVASDGMHTGPEYFYYYYL
jgi:hypothetical protein